MIYKKFNLTDYSKFASSESKLEVYLHGDNKIRPTMLVVPGGGYTFVAQSEAKPVALRYLSEGFNCFVLTYAIQKPYPIPHQDLACAIKYIRERQKEFNLDGNLFVVGFSAGGHLVGSYSYLYKEIAEKMAVEPSLLKPTAIILSYAVISLQTDTHKKTKDYITDCNPNMVDKLSIEKNVGKDYPPTFVWATEGDRLVSPEHTNMMAEVLKKNGVIYEKHIFPVLDHGTNVLSMDTRQNPRPFSDYDLICKTWVDKSINFIVNNFYKK